MKIINKKIEELKPYEKNARTHPQKQIDLLAKNIERFGFTVPVLIDKKNTIIAGHGRILAMKQLGRDEVPCVMMENLTDKEVKALRLADNQLATMSEWDDDFLLDELKSLDEELFNLTGFDGDLLLEDTDKDDEIPETPKKPRSKLGDLYEIGQHKVLCGDSTEYGAVLKLLEGNKKADMVFTDPPYNVNYSGTGKNTTNTILNDKMSDDNFDSFLEKVFDNYAKFSKETASWYVFHSSSTQHQFKKFIEKTGWNVKTQIIWNKPSASMGWGDYRMKHEPMFYCGKENTKFYGDRTYTSIWDFQGDEQELLDWVKKEKRAEKQGKTTIWTMKREVVGDYVHPTQKPVELICYALKNSSKKEDVILDFFGGSGSTLIACEKMNRRGYLMELDEKYVDIIIQRWVNFTGIEKIKLNGKEIIWKKNV